MTTRELLLSAWDWEPSVIVGCAALLAAYFYWARPLRSRKALCFTGAVLLLLLDLVSPLDALADNYLFSAHMLQHMVLILAVPPLLLLGLPRETVERVLCWRPAARLAGLSAHGALVWLLALGTLGLWHVPPIYDAALANPAMHIVQHLSFLVTSVMFWWLIVAPLPEQRLPAPAAVGYLFAACMVSTVLGAVIAFAPAGLYSGYLRASGSVETSQLIRQTWGLTPRFDQQLGGLLMWVPGCSVYLFAILATLLRWLSSSAADTTAVAVAADSWNPSSHVA